MKRSLKKAAYLLFLITTSLYAQKGINLQPEVPTCGEIKYKYHPVERCPEESHFEIDFYGNRSHINDLKLYDRFGNIYCDATITNGKYYTSRRSNSGNNFELLYGTDVPEDFVTIIDQVFSDLEQLIVFNNLDCDGQVNPVRIQVEVDDLNRPDINSNPLATATPLYEPVNSNNSNNMREGRVWRKINTGTVNNPIYSSFIGNNPNQVDAIIKMNSFYINSNSWYTGFATDLNNDDVIDNVIGNVYDLYGTILHEVMHCFGFASRINQNGSFSAGASYFDTLLYNTNVAFINNSSNPYNWVASWNNPGQFQNIYQQPCPNNTIRTVNGNIIPLYTSDDEGGWSTISSLSHIDDDCSTINHVMSPSTSIREYKRLTQDEVDILQSLQYTTTTQYGTQFLNGTSIPNPNRQEFTSNTHLPPYALHDNCNDFYTTIEACQTNTFIFSQSVLNDIIANDDNTIGSTVINLQLEYPNNSDVVLEQVSPGTFELHIVDQTLTGAYFIVQYQLKSSSGIISNTGNIYFYIIPCDQGNNPYYSSFNCDEDNDGCDLICNSELVAGDVGFMNFNTSNLSSGVPNTTINGWLGFSDVRVFGNNAPFNNDAPLITNDNLIHINFNSSYPVLLVSNLKHNLEPNKKYLLSYFQSGSPTFPNGRSDVGLFRSIADDTPYPNTFRQPASSFNPTPLIQNEAVPPLAYNWEQRVVSFPVNKNYEALYLGATKSLVKYDQVELIEDQLSPEYITTQYTSCNGNLTLGIPLCDITGVNYSWFDVTDATNPIQITNGSTDINANDGFSPLGNGSQLQINGVSNAVFELRRTFNPTTTFEDGVSTFLSPLNNGDASIQITVSCDDSTSSHFITTWRVDNTSTHITIPTFPGETYSYDVDWEGDGVFDDFGVTGDITHDYGAVGNYEVHIKGDFPRIYFLGSSNENRDKIIDVKQWGNMAWSSMESAFQYCHNLNVTAVDSPDLSNVIDMSHMFFNCYSLNQPVNHWDVSNVTIMTSLFANCGNFNQPLYNWDVSNIIGTGLGYFLQNTNLSVENYDNLLVAWNRLNLQNNVLFTSTLNYCAGESARQNIITQNGWNIADSGLDPTCRSISNKDDIDFTLFPNPSEDSIEIYFSIENDFHFYTEIKDVYGTTVIISENQRSINLNQLKTGIYFVRITTDLGETIIKKLIKQ